ncbi:hypothetical protein MMC07_002912 [Pseudocyphellaria aurata]|nr:hypothetical protein [Pseudocyphellaria aurata]
MAPRGPRKVPPPASPTEFTSPITLTPQQSAQLFEIQFQNLQNERDLAIRKSELELECMRNERLDARVRAEPGRTHVWSEFVDMLQNSLQPKAQREVKLWEAVHRLSQKPNQSVGAFLAYYESLEKQMDPIPDEWFARMAIFMGVHPPLRDALRLRGRIGKTRAEIEEKLRSIEGVGDLPAADPTYGTRRPYATNGPRYSSQTGPRPRYNANRIPVNSPPTQTAPEKTASGAGAGLRCYKCGKNGHIAKDCYAAPRPEPAKKA